MDKTLREGYVITWNICCLIVTPSEYSNLSLMYLIELYISWLRGNDGVLIQIRNTIEKDNNLILQHIHEFRVLGI